MNAETDNERVPRIRPSCLQCQRSKKRCDRRKPKCSLCVKHNKDCAYTIETSPTTIGTPRSFSTPSTVSDTPTSPADAFPAVFFLDSALFRRSMGQLPDAQFSLDPTILSFIGNLSSDMEFVSTYFTFIHPWSPFLSKRVFFEQVVNPLAAARAPNTLLVAAMKLVANPAQEATARTPVYRSVKVTLLRVEEELGVLDLRILQAMVLIALYELGHAIYPAAYLTIGHCIRYATLLGLNNIIDNLSEWSHNRFGSEEKRRIWWTIILLDRYGSLGCAERAHVLNDPSNDSILPMNDAVWEAGDLSANPILHRLSDPPIEAMGRFCLTAQASILLGRVFLNIHGQNNDKNGFQDEEIKVLDSTVAALTNVCLHEGRFRGLGICSPTTLCYSARFLLHDEERRRTSSSKPYHDPCSLDQIYHAESEIAASLLGIAHDLSTVGHCGAEQVSPFCLEALYRTSIFYARKHTVTGDDTDLKAFEDMKASLAVIGERWKAAETYIAMVEARSLTGIL